MPKRPPFAPRPALRLHRWISLAAASFWCLQALTGMLLVFHWEIDDALVNGRDAPLSLVGLQSRVEQLAPEGASSTIGSIWTSAGTENRFDIGVNTPTGKSVVRVNSAGEVLRIRSEGEQWQNGGWDKKLVSLHQNLLVGDIGSWIIGISGLLLITNIGLGLRMTWPRAGRWRQTLTPPAPTLPDTVQIYGWHRMLGLVMALPALALITAGVLLVFEAQTAAVVQPTPITAPASPQGPRTIGLADATATALAAFPNAKLAAIFPASDAAPLFKIRLTQPGEARRAYGTTTVFVSAADGSILASHNARTAPLANRFIDGLFAFHTGEITGTPGRIAILFFGLWLLMMMALGLRLWRRRSRTRAAV